MRLNHAVFATALIVLIPAVAAAHLELTEPPNRYGQWTQKSGPCGQGDGARGDNPTVFAPGQTITVRWDEFIDHPGHFRIAFDADGQDDFVDPVCLSGCDTRDPSIEEYSNEAVLLDHIADRSGGLYEVEVELPDVTCDNCTLQLIQVMYDKPPYELPGNDLYYNCADLVLRAGSGDVSDAGSVDTGAHDAGRDDTGVSADSDATIGADASETGDAASTDADTGGCVIAGGADSSPPFGFMMVLIAAGYIVTRRVRCGAAEDSTL